MVINTKVSPRTGTTDTEFNQLQESPTITETLHPSRLPARKKEKGNGPSPVRTKLPVGASPRPTELSKAATQTQQFPSRAQTGLESSSSFAIGPAPWMPTDEQMQAIGEPLNLNARQVKELLTPTYLWQGTSVFRDSSQNPTLRDVVCDHARALMDQAGMLPPTAMTSRLAKDDYIVVNIGDDSNPAAPDTTTVAPPALHPPTANLCLPLPSMHDVYAWLGLAEPPPVPVAYTKDLEQAAQNVTNAALNLGGIAATGNPVTDAALTAHAYGTTLANLRGIAAQAGGTFVPSASAGEDLKSLNDHVGVLILPTSDGDGSTVATRLAVVKAQVPAVPPVAGGIGVPAAEKYFVKGYDDKLLDIEQLQSAIQIHTTPAPGVRGPNYTALMNAQAPVPGWGGPPQQLMEMPFLSAVRILSDNSAIWARRSEGESDTVHMTQPPNPTPRARKEGWANSEAFMSPGAGPLLPNGTRKFQLDYNNVENRLMIFKNQNDAFADAAGNPARKNALMSQTIAPNVKKAPLMLSGPVLAEIRGIKHWELMGPADQHAGVKGGGTKRLISSVGSQLPDSIRDGVFKADELSNYLGSAVPGARIIITTDDDARHELRLTEAGIKMKLLAPTNFGKSGPIFGIDTPVASDVDVYSYRATDTGRHGTESGRVHSDTTMSTGEVFRAAPLVKNRSGVLGSVKAGTEALARLAFRQPGLGTMNHGKFTHLMNTAMAAAVQFATVFASSELNNLAKGGPEGTYLEGAESFSATGKGDLTSAQLATAAATIVVAQEAISVAFKWASHLIPGVYKSPESNLGKVGNFLVETGMELGRQETNYGIQHTMGLRPGTGWEEHGMMGASALLLTAIDKMHGRYGTSANHPHVNAAFMGMRQGAYNVMRSGQVALNKQGGDPSVTDFKEAIANRFMTRALDQIVVPLINNYLNEAGLLGPNARAFSRQSNNESKSLIPRMAVALDEASANVDRTIDDKIMNFTGDDDFYRWFNLTGEQSKQFLNRLELHLERTRQYMSSVLPPIPGAPAPNHAADIANNVANAGAIGFPRGANHTLATGQTIAINNMYRQFSDRVAKAGGPAATLVPLGGRHPLPTGGFPAGAGKPGAMTNALTELHPHQQQFSLDAQANFAGAAPDGAGFTPEDGPHAPAAGPTYLNAQVEQPTQVRYDNRTYVTHPKINVGRTQVPEHKVPRDQTTFSVVPQVAAYPKTKEMAQMPCVQTLLEADPPPVSLDGRNVAMSHDIKKRIDLAVRHYTVESQHFHYPSRWDVTGTPKIQEISPGLKLTYNHISKPGNVAGETSQFVDPIETLYVNLASVHAPKFPAEVYRAAVTDAQYRDRLPGEDASTRGVMSPGETGVLTEIFSASLEPKMVAAFGQGINGLGAVPKENSQRIVLAQETGVNVTTKTDLTQAEIVLTQGAVFENVYIDRDAGRNALAIGAQNQDIGQVVYAKQVDTYQLERAYQQVIDAAAGVPGAVPPPVGTKVINPQNGHWYEYQPANAAADANGLVLSLDTRNYFLGKQLESANNAGQPDTSVARWYEPFTSDEAPRTMKDAIHAAILRRDPIVPMLNDAVLNSHHTYFRQKGGFYNGADPRYAAERGQQALNTGRINAAGNGIVARTVGLGLNADLRANPEQQDMIAAMTSHMLRERVHLVPIAAGGAVVPANPAGGPPAGTLRFDKTFDKVDLERSPLDAKNPKPPITIGVAGDGYYVMRQVGGTWVADTKVTVDTNRRTGNAKTVGNLIHAVMAAGELMDHGVGGGYARAANTTGGGAANELTLNLPVDGENRVLGFKRKMETYFSTPYDKLQRGMCEAADEINVRRGIAGGARAL